MSQSILSLGENFGICTGLAAFITGEILEKNPCITAGLPVWKSSNQTKAANIFFELQEIFHKFKIIELLN